MLPGIFKAYSYSMAFYYLEEDPTISVRVALNKSKEATRGKRGSLFILQLSWLGWITLSIFTFGISLLWLLPYFSLTEYTAFSDMRYQEIAC